MGVVDVLKEILALAIKKKDDVIFQLRTKISAEKKISHNFCDDAIYFYLFISNFKEINNNFKKEKVHAF